MTQKMSNWFYVKLDFELFAWKHSYSHFPDLHSVSSTVRTSSRILTREKHSWEMMR